jgi:hypothetical protein
VCHSAPQALLTPGQGARRERAQHRALGPVEAQARRFMGGPVLTRIGHRHPRAEVRFERRERIESLRGEPVALHELHTGFGLAFGPGPIRRAGARLDVPIAAEGQIGRMKEDRPGPAIPADHQRPRIVAQ